MDRADINRKILELKEQMKNTKGRPCEVYSRCCGYLRPVQGYNPGKKEEFSLRSKFNVEKIK